MSQGSQDGIVLNEDRSVEAQLQRAKEERQKKLKKQKRRKIFLLCGAGAVVLLGIVIYAIVSAVMKNAPMTVFTVSPTKGDLESTIMASGVIESENVVHYYAPANILIEDCVGVGDKVAQGDVLISFDEEDFAFVLREVELENQITNNNYQSGLTDYNENKENLATANANIAKYQDLVNTQQATVDNLTTTITDANAIKVANLQNQIYEAQKAIAEYTYYITNAEILGLTDEEVKIYTGYIQEKEQAINALNYEISLTSGSVTAYEQQKQLAEAQNLLTDYKTELEKAKSEAEAYENALGNKYDAENIVLNGELNTMRSEKAYQDVLDYQEGAKADFNGVISLSTVESGAKTVAGTEMLTLASLDHVKVTFTITKSNLEEIKLGQKATLEILGCEYEGTVTKISGMAVAGSNGGNSIEVEIHIDNPDENIYLGLDAKIDLVTASKTDVLMLPVEAVSADKEGEFVYLVVDGVVVKRYVTLGISSDEYVEIVEGLEETDQVITMVSSDLEEGMPVMAMPEVSMEDMEMMTEGM